MPAPDSIKKLVDHFAALSADARQPRFNETQTRREFIDPFFEALGWDVSNRAGYSETYKDVIHEDALAVEGRSRAPDYAFRVGGRRVFFVEAKKPSVNLSEEQAPAFQLRRYAWTAKLPISILTDFEELAVYDCRIKPAQTDKPTTGRLMLLNYRDYISHWDELYARFSKEAVLRGDFDAYAETSRGKKGAADVDDDFLATIEGWRKALALNLALRNPGLNERDLNYAVQMTIDRILFLRIAEERGIERADQLKDIAGEAEIYPGLVQLFRLADQRYNSGLFHFSAEKGRGTHADTLTPALKVDDRVLKEIIRGLYYPVCPYAWYVLPAEILGQVYEQFLGRVIRLTPGHQAKVEEKPEVRKAGGVYYTPGYIVDYIVQQTVGQLLEGRTPAEAARLKIVDPACGSGSFLLGVYQHLLNWHLNWYTSHDPQSHARGARPAVFETRQGWALTTGRKKEILLNSIHGVDIDPQAVEVTKLSLLLKVLEGDLPAAETQLGLGLERMLPDLGSNIQCGNSLIGPDYYANRQLGLGLADDAEQYRVNAFDWQRAFPQVFAAGGFDAVIGNPPYIRIQALKEWAPTEVDYYKQRYKAASKGNYDIYVVFVEKGLDLLKATGRLGFILPHKFFNAQYGEPLRGLISAGKHLAKVVHFGDQQVFENATTYTCLMFLDKTASRSVEMEKVTDLAGWRNGEPGVVGAMAETAFTASEWNVSVGHGSDLFERLSSFSIKLGDIASMFVGLQTSADTVFLFKNSELSNERVISVYSKELGREIEIETALLKPVVRSGEINRYWAKATALVLFPYRTINGRFQLLTEEQLSCEYPLTWKYLLINKKLLSNREHGKFISTGWYQLYPKNLDCWEQNKIMIPYMITRLAAFHDENSFYFVNVTTGGFGITLSKGYTQKYLTGLLNSRLLDWYLKKIGTTFHGGYFAANKQFLQRLPLPSTNSDKKIENLVEQMLALHARRAAAHNPQELELLARQIEAADRAIDTLVYQLYGLSEAEIKIVEG